MYAFIHYTRTNPVLSPVLFSRLSPDIGKLLPTFVNQAVINYYYPIYAK